ncbi:MAG TPA: NAD-dependent deacylase [Candidatus Eisenbacteria bacterium]|nr:NAD-dependent deacylase [Candidatus Eisenbacteria bacterium]
MIAGAALAQASELLSRASSAVAFTGAGISEESGLPTYRGEGGLWTKFDPYKVASIEEFHKDPTVYWSYSLSHRRIGADPNPAHLALVELERAGRLRAVITQNTDGLHQKAGSAEVIELHGSSANVICLDCEARYPRADIDALNRQHCPPSCPACGGRYLKPTVVLFGEPRPVAAFARAQALAAQADMMLVVGSSLQVYPAAGIPRLARDSGAELLIINAEPTPFDGWARVVLHGKAGEILPRILELVSRG